MTRQKNCRVERLLIRADWSKKEKSQSLTTEPDDYIFGGNHIDFTTLTARCTNGDTVHLTPQEARLLKVFIAHAGVPVSRGTLLEMAWGYSEQVTTRTIDNFIVRFRKYFEKDSKNPEYFKSVRSVGYVLDV